MGKISDKHIHLEQIDDMFLVGNPGTGAISLLDSEELVAFHLFTEAQNAEAKTIQSLFEQWGYGIEEAIEKTNNFLNKMKKQGWLRRGVSEEAGDLLQKVYFTVTRNCNLSCPYCYQGLNDRLNTEMPVDSATRILMKIKEINPKSHIVVTGGEPFMHSKIFGIIEKIQDNDLTFCILTNGTLIDAAIAKRLAEYPGLKYIQVSMDGITEKTHSITRGNSFKKTLLGINSIIDQGIPFLLAPTIHDDNLDELYDIAHFAVTHGGFISPNNLRKFPHDSNNHLKLSSDLLYKTLKYIDGRLLEEFGMKKIAECKSRIGTGEYCDNQPSGAKFICGLAHSLVDIDWDGTVFPCNLLRSERFKLGNILSETFEAIFSHANRLGIRTFSYKIPKCKKCIFVSTCGGGCRAGAYYAYGTLSREDDLCEEIYKSQMDRLKMHANPVRFAGIT